MQITLKRIWQDKTVIKIQIIIALLVLTIFTFTACGNESDNIPSNVENVQDSQNNVPDTSPITNALIPGSEDALGADVTITTIIPSQVFIINTFAEGLARVLVGESWDTAEWGFIDETGQVVIPPQFDWARDFTDGLAAVAHGSWDTGIFWGYIDRYGEMIIPQYFDDVLEFSEGLAAVQIGGLWGYVDKSWDAVETQREITDRFVVNPQQFVIYPQFYNAGSFQRGLAPVMTIEWIESIDYEGVGHFTPFYRWGFIDTSGNPVIPIQYNAVTSFMSNGLAGVMVGEWVEGNDFTEEINPRWGLVDTTGREVVPPQFLALDIFACDYLIPVSIGDNWNSALWGAVDATGNMIIQPQFNSIGQFIDGVAIVRVDDGDSSLFGAIDRTGREIMPLQYEWISTFSYGVTTARYEGSLRLVDIAGNMIADLDYDESWIVSEGFVAVRVGDWETGLWGLIDTTGREIISPQFNTIWSFSEGFAVVGAEKADNQWGFGLVDTNGQIVLPLQYNGIYQLGNGLFGILEGEHWSIVRIDFN